MAAGLQRVGRAGHQVGAVSTGRGLPQAPRRPALLRGGGASGCARGRSRRCATRATRWTCWPSRSWRWWRWTPWPVAELAALVRRAAPFAELPDSALHAVLDMLSGRYPSDRLRRAAPAAGLGPRRRHCSPAGAGRSAWRSPAAAPSPTGGCSACSWPAPTGRCGSASWTRRWSTSPGSATCSCSAPPPGGSRRSPPTGCWSPRSRPAGPDAVLEGRRAGPAAGAGAGDRRDAAQLVRAGRPEASQRLRAAGLDAWAADNLLAYLAEQREATRAVPDDRTVVVERFRDELGDWRLAVHCVLGAKVNGPWALAIGHRLRRAVRRGRAGAALRRRHRGPAAGHRGRAARRRPGGLRPGRGRRGRRRRRSAGRRCSPRGSASAPPARCCCRAATRAGGSRCGSSANGPPSCSTWPGSSPTSRSPWRPPGSACRTCSTCPGWSR